MLALFHMTTKSLFRIAIQLSGLYFVFISIVGIPKEIALYVLMSKQIAAMGSLFLIGPMIGLALGLVLGLVLIFGANKITKLFLRADEGDPVTPAKADVIEVAMILVGVVTVVLNLSGLSNVIANIQGGYNPPILVDVIAPIVFGLVIIWKARAITRYILRINAIGKEQ